MKRIFTLPMIGALIALACNKNTNPSPPPPTDTATHPHQDTVHIGGDTTHKGGGDTATKPTPSVTKLYESNGWTITLDQKTQAVHEMEGSGFTAASLDVILDPTDTGAIRAELINLNKGTYTLSHSQYGGDTTWFYMFSNLNRVYQDSPALDTAGKLALHVYRTDGQDVRTGIKDLFIDISIYPNSTSLVGNGEFSFGPFRGDTNVISTSWLANKVAAQNYYFRRFVPSH